MTLRDNETGASSGELSPWRTRRLWSLWEMLDKYALLFSISILDLAEVKWLCASRSMPGLPPQAARIDMGIIQRAVTAALKPLRQACILSDLDSVIPEIERLERTANSSANAEALAQALKHLIARIQDELGAHYFFHVDQQDVPIYLDESGGAPSKFDWAREDMCEAGKCLALQRSTACVFHLMRVLEHAVQRLGTELKVEIDVSTESWHQICLHINKKTEGLPKDTEEQRKKKVGYAAAASHLTSVRIAWRNEVMHPKQTYTRQEALEIFNATRAFMTSLAEVL